MAADTSSHPQPPPPFTHADSLAKFDVPMETYLSTVQSTTPTPLHGLATGSIIFSKHHPDHATHPRVLLVQRSPTDSMPLRWEVPGGAVDAGETVLAGAAREVREEAGLAVTRVAALVVHPSEGARGEGVDGGYLIRTTRGKRIPKYTFLVDVGDSGCVRLDPVEHVDYVWATEEECRARRVVRRSGGGGGGGGSEDEVGVVELEFTTEAQEDAILNAFAMRRLETEGG